MDRMERVLMIVAGAAALTCSGAIAQNQGTTSPRTGQRQPAADTGARTQTRMQTGSQQGLAAKHLLRCSDIIGKDLHNTQNEDLGEINDLIIDAQSGRAAYAILGVGGFLGIGEDLFVVPWQSVQLRAGEDAALINATKEQLTSGPHFDKDNWPDFADRGYGETVFGHYGADPYWDDDDSELETWWGRQRDRWDDTLDADRDRDLDVDIRRERRIEPDGEIDRDIDVDVDVKSRPEPDRDNARTGTDRGRDARIGRAAAAPTGSQYGAFRRGSELIGLDVRNAEGEDLGNISDIMVEAGTGRIAYAVLSFGGFLGMGDKLFAVPWESLGWTNDPKMAVLSVDKEQLRNAPGFDKDSWPDMANQAWGERVHGYYGQEPYWNQNATANRGQDRLRGWGSEGRYNQMFKADQVKTVTGRVVEIEHDSPMAGMAEGVQLTIETDQGARNIVHLGPAWYLNNQNADIREDDQVTVRGAQADLEGDRVLLASEVTVDGRTLRLRDEQGWPAWSAWRDGQR